MRSINARTSKQEEARPRSFYDTDGLTGYSYDVIPDIIHLVRYNQEQVTFPDVVFYRSMYLNHRPTKIMVHCSPCNFTGPYARWIEGIPFTFVSTMFPTVIFGRHVRPLRRFLRYEATVSCPEGYTFGNMIMFSHKNSRILRLFMDTYRE
ncbi:hypothetical protein MTO96_050455 [Rhipicephalus appendiculatus]